MDTPDSGQRWGYPYAKASDGAKAPLSRVVDLARKLSAQGEGPIPEVLETLQRAVAEGRAALLLMAPNQYAAQVTDSTVWQQGRAEQVASVQAVPPKKPGKGWQVNPLSTANGARLVSVAARPEVPELRGVEGAFEMLRSLASNARHATSLDDPAHPAARLAVCTADAEAVFPSRAPVLSFWDSPPVHAAVQLAPGASLDLVQMPAPPVSTSAVPAVAPAADVGQPSGAAVGLVIAEARAVGGERNSEPRASVAYTPEQLQTLLDAESEERKNGRGFWPRLLKRFESLVPGRKVPDRQSLEKTLARAKRDGMTASVKANSSVFAWAGSQSNTEAGGGNRGVAKRT